MPMASRATMNASVPVAPPGCTLTPSSNVRNGQRAVHYHAARPPCPHPGSASDRRSQGGRRQSLRRWPRPWCSVRNDDDPKGLRPTCATNTIRDAAVQASRRRRRSLFEILNASATGHDATPSHLLPRERRTTDQPQGAVRLYVYVRLLINVLLAAWYSLTPQEHASANKRYDKGISRRGRRRVAQTAGTRRQHRHARCRYRRTDRATTWQRGILARRPVKVAVLAQAAKNARIAWALLVSGETYRTATPTAA